MIEDTKSGADDWRSVSRCIPTIVHSGGLGGTYREWRGCGFSLY